MYIRKIVKFILLIGTTCLIIMSINIVIQTKLQDAENKKSSANLIKIVTKNIDEKEDGKDIKIIVEKNNNYELKKETNENKSEILVSEENQGIEKELEQMKKKLTETEENVNDAKDKIDWNKLATINKDIIGWIEIPNTNINYPILKDNNLFYLNHNFDGKINRNGSIFIRNYNLFESEEITIYGHNMKNGTMFAKLANYINKEFLRHNSKFYIYTKENTYEGEIFAAYSKGINEEKEAIKGLDFNEKIKYYKNQSSSYENLKDNINKIVKLTTCSYLNARTYPTDQRYYVIGKIREI